MQGEFLEAYSSRWDERTRLLIGDEAVERIRQAHVLVVGLGGVGSAVVESLCRAGVGKLTLVDMDTIHLTNLNRQLIATRGHVGILKVDAWKDRIHQINPACEVEALPWLLKDEKIPNLLELPFDFIADCIDTLAPKAFLIYHAVQRHRKIISSLGSGGRLDPASVRIGDISETSHDRLGYYLRKRLHKLGIYQGIPVVYSVEPVRLSAILSKDFSKEKQSTVGTISYMPMVFGLFMSSYIIRQLIASN
jgi:tRNA A37 threonylcarbamoyladenosine dehydratase